MLDRINAGFRQRCAGLAGRIEARGGKRCCASPDGYDSALSSSTSSVCFAWNNVPIKDWSYVFDKELIVAGAGTASSINQYPQVLNRLLHTRFKIITGYPGSREAVMSVEKGEAQGVCGIQWSSFVGPYQDWMTQKKITPI